MASVVGLAVVSITVLLVLTLSAGNAWIGPP
jgi:hypothetical protein